MYVFFEECSAAFTGITMINFKMHPYELCFNYTCVACYAPR